MRQQTMFGAITPGMKFYFHGLREDKHLLTVKKARHGKFDLVKPCGATFGSYTEEEIWEMCEEVGE